MSSTDDGRADHPLVLVIDESAGMAGPWAGEAGTKAELLAPMVDFLLRLLPDDPALLVALIGYSGGPEGGTEVGSRWGGGLAGSDFVPVPRLCAAPLKGQQVTDPARPAGAGGAARSEAVPSWYQPRAVGDGRPQCAAFRACEERLLALERRGRPVEAPVVVHVTSGASTDGDPAEVVRRILDRPAVSAIPLVVHAHLASSRGARPLAYPSEPSSAFPAEAANLFNATAPLGEQWCGAAERAGAATGAGPAGRGVLFDARKADLARLFKVVATLVGVRRVVAPAPGPAPAPTPTTEPAPSAVAAPVPVVALPVPSTAPAPTPTVAVSGRRGDANSPASPPPAARPSLRGLRVAWSFPPPAAKGTARLPLRNSLVVDPAGTLLACLQSRLVAFTPGGAGVWSYPTGGHIPGSPFLGDDGLTRVHSDDGFLHAVAPDGSAGWAPVEVGPPLGRATPVVDGAGTTWVCPAGGGLLGVDAGGRLVVPRPFYDSDCLLNSTGLVHDGVLYVGGEDYCVHAVALGGARGRNLWDIDADRGRTGWYINSALALGPGSVLVVASYDEHLYAFHPDGTTAGRVRLPGPARGSPVVAGNGRVYLGVARSRTGGEGGALVRADVLSGDLAVLAPAEGAVESTPVIGDDGVIYFGDNAGVVRAVDPSGSAVWECSVGSPVRSPGAVVAPGLVAFGLDDGTVVALRCSSRGLANDGWPMFMGGRRGAGG